MFFVYEHICNIFRCKMFVACDKFKMLSLVAFFSGVSSIFKWC